MFLTESYRPLVVAVLVVAVLSAIAAVFSFIRTVWG